MIDLAYLDNICQTTESKIVMLVVDGLGGLAHPDTNKSELETADLPNLDALARRSACGLTTPVGPGITPGSGPGHMALFGYDPVKYMMGRGVLEAVGIDADIDAGDVAARGNFCTIDSSGLLTDRRAGRIPSRESAPLVAKLNKIKVPGINIDVYPVQDYRFVLKLRGLGLSEFVSETDPQEIRKSPRLSTPLIPEASKTAEAVNSFSSSAQNILAGQHRANMVLLRGFSKLPKLPDFGNSYKLASAAIAGYPMYRGLAKLVGMDVLPTGSSFDEEVETLEHYFPRYDFFFLHYKPSDAAGEDGDFEAKVKTLERLDSFIPRIIDLGIDTLVITGDHSTPAIMGSHSWHPVPLLIHSKLTKGQGIKEFTETACVNAPLGNLLATNVMITALAHAGKLSKFGP